MSSRDEITIEVTITETAVNADDLDDRDANARPGLMGPHPRLDQSFEHRREQQVDTAAEAGFDPLIAVTI